MCNGKYTYHFNNKKYLKDVMIYHYHYGLGRKIKENDNRRGDLNCLEQQKNPDWNFTHDEYQIKTERFRGKHPKIIAKYLRRGKSEQN